MQTIWQHEVTTYYGLEAHRFSNRADALLVVPALSGRAMFYGPQAGPNLLYERLEELALLTQPNSEQIWRNYGGYKCWLAPQEQTGWPPDPNIDGAPFVAQLTQTETGYRLDLQGPPSTRFGIRIMLGYQLDNETGLTVLQGFENISKDVVEWSAWDVTQVPASGYVLMPKGVVYTFPNFGYKPPLRAADNFYRVEIVGQPPEFKLGIQNLPAPQTYQLIFQPAHSNLQLIKTFDTEPNQNYPHSNPVEVYNCHIMPYGEIELNSPLVRLQPDELYQFQVKWSIGGR